MLGILVFLSTRNLVAECRIHTLQLAFPSQHPWKLEEPRPVFHIMTTRRCRPCRQPTFPGALLAGKTPTNQGPDCVGVGSFGPNLEQRPPEQVPLVRVRASQEHSGALLGLPLIAAGLVDEPFFAMCVESGSPLSI